MFLYQFIADTVQLARAGFFYNPTASTPDNTTCYLCHSSLDGWEEDDSAIGEHLSFSPDCGWATLARIEQDIDDGNLAQKDPMDESLLNARKMTFGANWPHEDKRGWVCKTQKVGAHNPLANHMLSMLAPDERGGMVLLPYCGKRGFCEVLLLQFKFGRMGAEG